MGKRIPIAVRRAIREDLRATAGTPEGSLRKVAARHGVSTDLVHNISGEMDIDLGRQQTANATAARQADLAARRAALAEDLMAFAEENLRRARAVRDGEVVVPDETPEYAIGWMPNATQLMVGLGIAIDKHKVLDQYDSEAKGLAAVDAFLRSIAGDAHAVETDE